MSVLYVRMLNNDTNNQIQTFTTKSKTGFYKLIVFLEIGVTGFLIFLGYTFLFRVQKPKESKVSQAAGALPLDSPIPTKYEIPNSYEVKAINATDIILTGTKGELVVPNGGPGVLVFKGTPAEHTEASTTDLQVGQKITLEIIPGEKVWIYIY